MGEEKEKRGLTLSKRIKDIVVAKITIGHGEDEHKLADDLKISDDLEMDCINQPSLCAWWGVLLAGAKKAAERSKFDFEVQEAQTYLRIREEKESKCEKVTETMLNNLVKEDEDYISANKLKIKSFGDYEIIRAATEAINQKKDMLVTLVSLRKQEMASGITISDANNSLRNQTEKKLK